MKLATWWISICILVTSSAFSIAQSVTNSAPPIPPADIIQRMVSQNQIRAEHLKCYTAERHYHIDVHELGKALSADMHAQVTYTADAGKTFRVVDQSGSHILLDRVLLKLLDTEQDDSRQKGSALTPSNYNFVFLSQTTEIEQTLYVFSVEPKIKNKFLYRGKIWIDATDYALVRVEAQPAENPSFWIKSTEIHSAYTKNGEFWLPQTNRSESKIRFGGKAVLTIDYGTYKFDAAP